MDDKIKVTCTRCRSIFREKASRVRDGYQANCPSCGAFINFSSDSMEPAIRKAMTEARRRRNGYVMPTQEENA